MITGGAEKLLSVIRFDSATSKSGASNAGKLSLKLATAGALSSIEQQLTAHIQESRKEHEDERREEKAKYSVVSNKTNVVSDRSNTGQDISSISSPDYTDKEETLHTGQNKGRFIV